MTNFQLLVYEATKKIPFGKVATYQDIAIMIGRPKAVRAVGNALHHNPTMIVIPCHRVVNAQGGLAKNFGYDGPEGQRTLLESEGIIVEHYHVDLKIYRAFTL
ncbi:MAG: MGMT family protein [Bacilli bacterium]|jgi:methylated-DNA-protein-cysteine methyltransferase-like protein|nr:MGMT family protein [Bacilli bacterium]